MAALTPISRKPVSFYVPVVALAGAIAGLFVGTAQGSSLLGILLGAVLMGGAAFAMTQIIKERNIDVTHDELPMIKGDRTLLNQLFQNLLGNACKSWITVAPVVVRPDTPSKRA